MTPPTWVRRAALLAGLLAIAGSAAAQGASALRIVCDGAAAGAEVTVNGKFKGECPLDMEIGAGRVEIVAVKKVDAQRERRFTQAFGIGEGVVKRVEVALGPPQLNAEAQRAEDERKRVEAERKRAADEAARKAEAERQARAEAEAARQAEFRRLAAAEEDRRRRERAERVMAAFQAAGLSAGTGQGFRDCPECPEMVWIPPGRAPQVAGGSQSQRWYNESEFLLPLAVGRFEVTFAEWDACVVQGGCRHEAAAGKSEGFLFDSSWGRGRQPVINVSWNDAQQYLAWLSAKTGQRYRLLSQLEFNYAARAGATTSYPWGDRLDAGAANCKGCGGKAAERTLAVGSFPANAWGLHDMLGNVGEYTADCYGSRSRGSHSTTSWETWVNLPERARDGRPIDLCSAAPGRAAVSDPAYGLAGGFFSGTLGGPLLTMNWSPGDLRSTIHGFRVAREFVPPAPRIDAAALAPWRDCADCPELVSLPAGRYEMGTPYLFAQGWSESETPLRWVSVPAFAIGRTEVTRAQWAAFQRERPAAAAAPASAASAAAEAPGCAAPVPSPESQSIVLRAQPGRSWLEPGFPQDDAHPAVCITRADAEAYLAWLSQRSGQRYRLPTEAEWEYAARAGSEDRRPWINDAAAACSMANIRDHAFRDAFGNRFNMSCRDGFAATAPVARFPPNAWGLHDMLGNVDELVADCWGPYKDAPSDGRAALGGSCLFRVVRGGSWFAAPNSVSASHAGRQGVPERHSAANLGLRVVRELGAGGAPR